MKQTKTRKKKYCVHIFQRYEYENVEAKNPQEAEGIIMNSEWANNYEDISEVKVMLQCTECGYDNSPKNTKCDECGLKI